MKTLLKKSAFFLAIASMLSSCSREEVPEAKMPEKTYKLSGYTYKTANYTETTSINYTDQSITLTSTRSSEPGVTYTSKCEKNGNLWTMISKKDDVVSLTGKIFMTNNGSIDSTAYFNSMGNLNSKSKYLYNSDGYTDRNIVDYVTYKHDYKYHYNNGNVSYWKNNFTHVTNPSMSKVDSITFEYYPELNFVTPYKPFPLFADGKQNKNLVKKKSYYNLTSGGLYLTLEYLYEVDNNGLVRKETINMYTQPGNVLYRNEEYNYTYTEQN